MKLTTRDGRVFLVERRKEVDMSKEKQYENVIETNENERAIVLQRLIHVCRSIYRR